MGEKHRCTDFDEEADSLLHSSITRPRDSNYGLAFVVLIVALTVSVTLNVTSLANRKDLDHICALYTSLSSPPGIDHVDLKYQQVPFNGSLFHRTVYTDQPKEEVDDAWLALGTRYRPMVIAEGEEAEKAGIDKGMLKRSPEVGGGYFANVEGLHHLHCLNLLRQTLYWNYDYYQKRGEGPFENDEEVLHAHSSHCVDILRQQLMCTMDFNVFGQFWIDSIDGPFPDFMTTHKCKNFNAVRQWAFDNQIPADDKTYPVLREGDVVLPDIP